ncbi:MAG TPA: hypothetical protein VF186_09615 [Gaiellaceae bacterium]
MNVTRPGYRFELGRDGLRASLSSPSGEHWLTLVLLNAFDAIDSLDETIELGKPVVEGDTLTLERRSTVWDRAGLSVTCTGEGLELRSWVEGKGRLADVHLLGGRSLLATTANGFFPTGTSFRTLFSPNPGDPPKLVRPAAESAIVGVSGDGFLGRGHWFFTPAPLFLALTTAELDDPAEPVDAGWLGLGLAAPVEELGFVQVAYRPGDRAFHLALEYEGHTEVDGRFEAPALLLRPGLATPYAGIRAQRDELAAREAAPPVRRRELPAWWRQPMFCGWGSQIRLSAAGAGPAPALATQENYDRFLGTLAEHDLVPGTVVIDDKWQDAYGTNRPDPAKWPDLPGWIAGRREQGQHVLLWWKAWDAEGLPEELCVRTPAGRPVALDPTNPRACAVLRETIGEMLSPAGLGAEGLKIDFTARTPSGASLVAHGGGWGIALLHRLLSVVYAAAKHANPEALVITHTPHPAFADVTDMVRLNDMLRMDDPGPLPAGAVVPQMLHRARVASAALPDALIDTDDWAVPDRATWRAFQEEKPDLGVPSLYYVTDVDTEGEPLEEEDYALLRRVWAEARAREER